MVDFLLSHNYEIVAQTIAKNELNVLSAQHNFIFCLYCMLYDSACVLFCFMLELLLSTSTKTTTRLQHRKKITVECRLRVM